MFFQPVRAVRSVLRTDIRHDSDHVHFGFLRLVGRWTMVEHFYEHNLS